NFTDNPIEWFSQYQVRFHPAHMRYLPQLAERMKQEIRQLETAPPADADAMKRLARLKTDLPATLEHIRNYTAGNYRKLSQRQRNLHEKAFSTNSADPNYHDLATIKYGDGAREAELPIPKG